MGLVLVEREVELAALEAALDGVRDAGRLLVVSGPPGIGKTSLVRAALQGARERGMPTATATAFELERSFPFGLVRRLYAGLLQDAAPEVFSGPAALARPAVAADEVPREPVAARLFAI